MYGKITLVTMYVSICHVKWTLVCAPLTVAICLKAGIFIVCHSPVINLSTKGNCVSHWPFNYAVCSSFKRVG